MRATIRAWVASQQLMQPNFKGMSPSALLWMNPRLTHFYELPDPGVWATRGIKTVGDVTHEGSLLTFDLLKTKFILPNQYFFCYGMLTKHNVVPYQ